MVHHCGPGSRLHRKRRQKWITVRGTKKQAEAKLARLLHQLDKCGFVETSKLTVGGFLQQWLRDYAATNVRDRTIEGYRDIVDGHLVPNIGGIPLTQLNGSHLQAYYAKALKSGRRDGQGGLSRRSVLHRHRVLREALNHAVKWGLATRNAADTVDPPRLEKTEMKTLDNLGIHCLLEAARDTVYFPLLHLTVYTGLRRSELLGLRRGDVDLDLGTLLIGRVMHRIRGEGVKVSSPKTPRSRRQVELAPNTALALRAHRERQEAERALLCVEWTPESLVFGRPDGSPLRPDTVTHAFSDISKRAGLDGIRLHDLRHTHATLMMEQGANPKVVSERLGHASVAITLDTYSHVSPTLQAEAALRFEDSVASLAGKPEAVKG